MPERVRVDVSANDAGSFAQRFDVAASVAVGESQTTAGREHRAVLFTRTLQQQIQPLPAFERDRDKSLPVTLASTRIRQLWRSTWLRSIPSASLMRSPVSSSMRISVHVRACIQPCGLNSTSRRISASVIGVSGFGG